MATQLETARSGHISDAMKCVANQENMKPELIRDEIAAGRLVIPANVKHLADNLVPAGIGRALTVKINANIGASNVKSSLDGELRRVLLENISLNRCIMIS